MTIEQTALAEIQRLVDPEASEVDPIEPMEGNGWATAYRAGNKVFRLFYSPTEGYEAFPMGEIKTDAADLESSKTPAPKGDRADSFSPAQKRDKNGRWVKGGGGSTTKKPKPKKLSIKGFSIIEDSAEIKKKAQAWDEHLESVKVAGLLTVERSIERTRQKLSQTNDPKARGKLKVLLADIEGKKQEAESMFRDAGIDIKRARASYFIAKGVRESINGQRSRVAGIIDDKGNLQAAFSYNMKKDHVYISLLASAPWNVLPGEKQTRGSGTAAIEAAVKLSQQSGKGGRIKLEATDSAIPFYEKVGFKRINDIPTMELDEDAANRFLQRLQEGK